MIKLVDFKETYQYLIIDEKELANLDTIFQIFDVISDNNVF